MSVSLNNNTGADFEDISLKDCSNQSDSSGNSSRSSRDDLDEDVDDDDDISFESGTSVTTLSSESLNIHHKLNGYAINSYKSKSTASLRYSSSSTSSSISRRESLPSLSTNYAPPTTIDQPHSFTYNQHPLSRQRSMNALNRQMALSRTNSLYSTPSPPLSGKSSTSSLNNRRASDGLQTSLMASKKAMNPRLAAYSSIPSKHHVKAAPLLRKAINGEDDGSAVVSPPPFSSSSPSSLKRSNSIGVRLTRKQLEQHFDNTYYQEDDDLPDNSCMFNVPLSPALYAKSKAEAVKNVQNKRHQKNSSKASPTLSGNSEFMHLSSIKESESVTSFFTGDGIEDLSTEAQDLTRAFEEMPIKDDVIKNSNRSSASSSRRSSSIVSGDETQRSSLTSVDIMSRHSSLDASTITPIPISKTKESVLSKTRPSWLPPKSQDEEKRHLKEYQRLVEQANSANKKREDRRMTQEHARLKQEQKDEELWTTEIIPKLENYGDKDQLYTKYRELWWRGVSTKLRGKVWRLRIGNKLEITSETFTRCLNSPSKHIEQIHEEASGTYSELKIFDQYTGPLYQDLVSVLTAYSNYRPDIGYKSGINNMVAIFLLNMSPLDSFIAFANLIDDSISSSIYNGDEKSTTNFYAPFLRVFNTKLPSLYQHFQNIRLSPSAYLEPMIKCWFTRYLTIDLINRLWDIMIFEGDVFLIRIALAILTRLQYKLYGSRHEILNELVPGKIVDSCCMIDEQEFITAVQSAFKKNP